MPASNNIKSHLPNRLQTVMIYTVRDEITSFQLQNIRARINSRVVNLLF